MCLTSFLRHGQTLYLSVDQKMPFIINFGRGAVPSNYFFTKLAPNVGPSLLHSSSPSGRQLLIPPNDWFDWLNELDYFDNVYNE